MRSYLVNQTGVSGQDLSLEAAIRAAVTSGEDATVYVPPGVHEHMEVKDFPTASRTQTVTVQATGPRMPWVKGNPVGGSDTAFFQTEAHLHFRGVAFGPDDRAILKTGTVCPREGGASTGLLPDGLGNGALSLTGCYFGGGFDPTAMDGEGVGEYLTKWGRHFYEMTRYVERNCHTVGIGKEHGFYEHPGGDHPVGALYMVSGGSTRWCGRTAFQWAPRNGEVAKPGKGLILLLRHYIEDVCIGDGGSAVTWRGQAPGYEMVLRGLSVRMGGRLDPEKWPTTGAVVVDRGDPNKPEMLWDPTGPSVGKVTIEGGTYNLVGGDRAVWKIHDATEVEILNPNVFAPDSPVGLDLANIQRLRVTRAGAITAKKAVTWRGDTWATWADFVSSIKGDSMVEVV